MTQMSFFNDLGLAQEAPAPKPDVISVYSWKQAVKDGVLHDVTELAREAGFIWPVAITTALKHKIEDIPKSQSHQDYTGRLWDVLYMGHLKVMAVSRRQPDATECTYQIIMHHIEPDAHNRNRLRKYIWLKIVIEATEPGGEPCFVISLPDED